MIGKSAAFQQAVQQATQVARSDVGVLLSGESGTGKELLAAHIHRESPVASGPFVKVNCAAIPTELIESELFGHEKGAFTGAASARRGKFELADGGTIFLDEVGDLHEASQAKLLRVLQDGELQRVGGEQSIRVTVRVDLGHQSAPRRADRGRQVPRGSLLPAERGADSRAPASRAAAGRRRAGRYFLAEFCARNNFRRARDRSPTSSPCSSDYHWPGNVRELRNVVERMAILTPGDRITTDSIPLEIRLAPSPRPAGGLQDVRDTAERDASARRSIRPTGTSPAPRGCSAPSARACTSGSAHWTSSGASNRVAVSPALRPRSPGKRRSACQRHSCELAHYLAQTAPVVASAPFAGQVTRVGSVGAQRGRYRHALAPHASLHKRICALRGAADEWITGRGRLEGRGRDSSKPHRSETDCTRDSVPVMPTSESRVPAKGRNPANEMRFPASREDDGDASASATSVEATPGDPLVQSRAEGRRRLGPSAEADDDQCERR